MLFKLGVGQLLKQELYDYTHAWWVESGVKMVMADLGGRSSMAFL